MKELQRRAYSIAKSKGFEMDSDIIQLLLIGTEIYEAINNFEINIPNRLKPVLSRFKLAMDDLEWLRENIKLSDTSRLNKKNNLPEELADIVLRTMSYAEHKGIDLQPVIEWKLGVNETREHLHGKKF